MDFCALIEYRFEKKSLNFTEHPDTSENGADHSKIRSYYPAGVRQTNDASMSDPFVAVVFFVRFFI